jgi:Rad3-related DNA helicase
MLWQSFFPFAQWRLAQAEGLDFICQALKEADDVFLEAPTGIGKSAMAIALARLFAAADLNTYLSTTTVSLEDQYMHDFAKLGLRQLHSKSRYLCPRFRSCDVGSRCRCESARDEADESWVCPYEKAKAKFNLAQFSIANASFLCTCARFLESWTPRDLAVFDEAHLLHDTITDGYSCNIHSSEVKHFPSAGDETNWLEQHYAFQLDTQIRELQVQLDDETQKLEGIDQLTEMELQRLCRKLERAEQKQKNLFRILNDDPTNWIFDQQPDQLSIKPLWATSFAAKLLPRIGQKRVYLSATLPGFRHQARYLGIDPKKVGFLALPSPFPLEHRLIHICPVVKWDFRNPELAVARLCRVLEKILLLHPADRGIVHVSSYYQARAIVVQCRSKRLITHETARDKDAQLEHMFAKPGTVLVSPSSHEGLDLYGDHSRFQVIAKLPYASLGDKRVKKRMEVDPDWYVLNTAQKFVQACGRSVRSDTDYATTYIVDAAFENFYHRASHFFPEYILEALRVEEVNI